MGQRASVERLWGYRGLASISLINTLSPRATAKKDPFAINLSLVLVYSCRKRVSSVVLSGV